MGIITWIIFGLLAGLVAKLIMPGKDPGGFIVIILVGIAGALVGGFIAKILGINDHQGFAFDLKSFIIAVLGSIVLLFAFFTKRRIKPNLKIASAAADTGGKDQATLGPTRTSIHRIFISYRHNDTSDVVGRIYDRLVQHFGTDKVFKDVESIPLGVDFRKHLADSVGRCQLVLTVIGTRWLVGDAARARPLDHPGDFVRMEIESALDRDVPVIPVLVQGAVMPSDDELPQKLQPLAYHNAIAIRPDPDFHQDVTRLIKGIEVHLSAKGGQLH